MTMRLYIKELSDEEINGLRETAKTIKTKKEWDAWIDQINAWCDFCEVNPPSFISSWDGKTGLLRQATVNPG